MKMTMKEIAKMAGVSVTTVSLIINGKDQSIGAETRDRVLKLIEETGYVPNGIAPKHDYQADPYLGIDDPGYYQPLFRVHGAGH